MKAVPMPVVQRMAVLLTRAFLSWAFRERVFQTSVVLLLVCLKQAVPRQAAPIGVYPTRVYRAEVYPMKVCQTEVVPTAAASTRADRRAGWHVRLHVRGPVRWYVRWNLRLRTAALETTVGRSPGCPLAASAVRISPARMVAFLTEVAPAAVDQTMAARNPIFANRISANPTSRNLVVQWKAARNQIQKQFAPTKPAPA